MTSRPHSRPHAYSGAENLSEGMYPRCVKMEGEPEPGGKSRASCAFANNVGLWVPGLISLAVRMRTTGLGLALEVERRGKKSG